MKTTLEIPDPLFRQVKARAALNGLKLKDLVSRLLETGLRQPSFTATQSPADKPCPFPLIRGKGGPLMKTMSNKVIGQVEEEHLERHSRSPRR